jgi:hypothetical protein
MSFVALAERHADPWEITKPQRQVSCSSRTWASREDLAARRSLGVLARGRGGFGLVVAHDFPFATSEVRTVPSMGPSLHSASRPEDGQPTFAAQR